MSPQELEASIRQHANYPLAVCLLTQNDAGEILAVSRRNSTTQFGLPGGKVDAGERPLKAPQREVAEETGLMLRGAEPVYAALCPGDVDYFCITYTGTVSGDPHTDEPIEIAWVGKEVLLQGPFAPYYPSLFEVLGL